MATTTSANGAARTRNFTVGREDLDVIRLEETLLTLSTHRPRR